MIARIFLILILVSHTVFAQYKPKVFEIGPKVGLNVSGIATLDTITFKKKISANFQVGFFTRLNLGKFNVQPEFIYQQKGATFSSPSQAKYSYKYLSVPVLFGYTPIKGLFLETGPEYSFALNSGYKRAGATIYGPDAKKDLSWVAGVRVNMLDMFSLLSLNLRYTQGLTDQSDLIIKKTPVDFRNKTVQLSVSYSFSEYYLWKKKHGIKKKR